jgi:hypothetical protein
MSTRSVRFGVGLTALALSLCLAGLPARAAEAAAEPASDLAAAEPPSPVVRELARWAVTSGDNQGLPFAVVDKTTATIFVYGAYGTLLGAEPVLLGAAVGDDSVPGIGDRPMSKIRLNERTTPAGRFLAAFGPAKAEGGRTLWVDYGTAISLHPVVTTNRKERRVRRLQSPSAADNRITYGCINVSAEFYEAVVLPAFEATKSVFYVLPDTKRLDEVLPGFAVQARFASGTQSADASSVEPAL